MFTKIPHQALLTLVLTLAIAIATPTRTEAAGWRFQHVKKCVWDLIRGPTDGTRLGRLLDFIEAYVPVDARERVGFVRALLGTSTSQEEPFINFSRQVPNPKFAGDLFAQLRSFTGNRGYGLEISQDTLIDASLGQLDVIRKEGWENLKPPVHGTIDRTRLARVIASIATSGEKALHIGQPPREHFIHFIQEYGGYEATERQEILTGALGEKSQAIIHSVPIGDSNALFANKLCIILSDRPDDVLTLLRYMGRKK